MPAITIKASCLTSISPRLNIINGIEKLSFPYLLAYVRTKSVISFFQDANHAPYLPNMKTTQML
jgi:hypothetical protein